MLTIKTVLNSRMLTAVELVKNGQFVTITVSHGAVSIKTVARAMEGGSLGQTIKVKNETTKDIYDVVLTGPQQGVVECGWPGHRCGSRRTDHLAPAPTRGAVGDQQTPRGAGG